jgi:ABC-type Fe3+-siderophore transport system permease subunit
MANGEHKKRKARLSIGILAVAVVLCFFGSVLIGEKTEEFANKELFGRVGETCRIVLRHVPLVGKLIARQPFCIVVLPDTQFYSEKYPDISVAQTEWIKENEKKMNIIFVVHEGDLTNDNSEEQWRIADRAMSVLDGVVPYCVAIGNHDMGPGGSEGSRDTRLFNRFFGVSRFKDMPSYRGHFGESNENCYHSFAVSGMKFLILCLEFGPREEVLEWADEVVSRHKDHRVIVVTHCYMYLHDTRVGKGNIWGPRLSGFPGNSGEETWEKFVRKHKDIFLVLSGHIPVVGVGRLTSPGDDGNRVHQLLANYQMKENGGNGWLRIMKFVPEANEIRVTTYSPVLKEYAADEDSKFELDYAMRDETMEQIIWAIRVPRLILALLVGASLAAAGAVMQCFFQNPMASPYIVGVSSGAALGATVAFAFDINVRLGGHAGGFVSFLADQPVALLAFAGGLGVTFIVYLLSRRGGRIHLPTLLLTGIALGTLALALAWFVLFLRRPYDYEGIIFWLMGSFNGKGWSRVAMVFPYVVIGIAFISIFARDLNVMLLGEETAQHLGVHVERVKLLLLIASTILAAACVAAVGVIGFVGLVVPHLMRLLVGPDHRRLIPACLLGGGLLLILADDAARILFREMIPIGVITSMLGCPFFLYLLTRKEKRFF